MNNESINFPKIITTVSNTSTPANSSYSSSISSSSASTANILSPKSSSLSLSSTSQPYSTSTQFDVTVNAIAAVVNASNNLPVTTPPNAAAVVAVAVSSLAAAIIPDTPIVSIAGSTLSEITTTTTSTKTTPTPVPTSKESENSNNLNIKYKTSNKDFQNKTLRSSSSSGVNPSSSTYSTQRASAKGLGPMSVANSSVTGALTNASTTAADAGAAEIKSNTNSIKHIKDISTGNSAKGSSTSFDTTVTKSDSLAIAIEPKSIIATTSSQPIVANATVSTSKTDEPNVTPNQTKSKDSVSESWEESRIKDWDDSKLKELLDEAYSYKNPRDKENKSKTFLQLLEKAENEDQSYPFCVTSRGSRNLSNSITSNSYHHYQQNTHYHSHSHNHNRSHHHHKQGGSLQDLFEIGLHETQLDCDQTFGIGISGNQRTRRQNHNSRQKKYSSSVSSRQREGGSLPSNVNVTHQLSLGGSGVVNDISLLQQEATVGTPGTNTNKSSKKEQRRNALKATASAANACTEVKENNSSSSVGEAVVTNKTTTSTTNSTYTASGGDFVIDIGEPMIDIQQQQKILQCKGQDAATQGHPFYERLANNDKRIPRANIIGSAKATYFAPTTSHCYVDETVRFNALERNGCTSTGTTQSTIDAKFLPLDENYKSCKSVLGSDGDKSPEMLGKSKTNTIYTKISSPASGSAILTATTNNIATLTQRQLDENGNALSEIYQNSSGAVSGTGATIQINAVSPTAANASAALLNSCGNVSTSATVTISPHTASTTVSTSATVTTAFTSGPSQAKAKAKKKSQQERNTKNIDVESVVGYRGKDPVEELVKYIESSGEDKQTVSKSGEKKKERKKEKEKHQKLKKSNSLEELRSGAKMEVHELKRTAATTESNAVLVRQKNGGGGKQNKNNSSSTADINKNLDSKTTTQTTNPRKSDRRSWGNEDLKYLEDQQNANLINEDKYGNAANTIKERKSKIGSTGGGGASLTISLKEEKEIKDKTFERNERNLTNNLMSTPTINSEKSDKPEKSEKTEKTEKAEKSEKNENKLDKSEKRKKQDIPANAVTVVDILAIESVLPETAEFHVVTKKKKPKKQKVINNLEETTVTFNRTHNFTMQKTSTFNQQQQQMTVRYKYYHHDNSSNTGISNTNTNSPNYQQPSSQHQQSSNFNTNNVAANISQHPNQYQNQQQQNQQQQQQHQQHNENYTNTNDKSRRKSTSSVPPSEKSDSSDLDSVHSLPIESSKANASNTNLNTNKPKTQPKSKGIKNTTASVLGNNMTPNANKTANLPAPISYADIARTNKEIADAAAAGSGPCSGSASGVLINNNEISTECRNADILTLNEPLSTDEKLLPTTNNPITTTAAVANLNAANLKPHKIKKSQIKQDFPELSGTSAVSNDENKLGTNSNHKTITYSQSLTAVTNPIQTVNSNQNPGSVNCVAGLTTANDSSQSSFTDVNIKASPTEQQKNIIIHQHANIPPLQHPQQLVLQKSKSVENDSTNSSTTTTSVALSSAAGTYMAPLNSNNLDQQYPALEKTVKRHSSANVTMLGASTNQQQTPFNFAAAAKQQIANNASPEQYIINANKNSALTTSNTNNNNNTTNQVALITANKKSKEKTPPLTATATQQITPDNSAFNANTNINTNLATTAAGSAITNPKKSKKERQQQQHQVQQTSADNTQLKQNQNIINNTLTNKKPLKTPLKSSNSLPLGLSASAGNSSTSTSASVNRPAVIILNDYRNSGSCAADNQFTFGDFNEEELKLFDDDNNTAAVNETPLDDHNHDINMNRTEEEENHQCASKSEAVLKSPTATYFNDSGTSCGNDMVNNSCSELLSSSIEASSPNTSFVASSNVSNLGGAPHMPVLNNNQSSDSGIYTGKTKSSNSSHSSGTGNTVKQKQSQQITPTKEENGKLNSFLSKTRCASVHTSMDNLAQPQPQPQPQPQSQPPPPQQLETCNDIETAIIAAARAAAKHQHPPQNHHQQQQQQYKNSNTSSNSSSFSSSSHSSTSSAYQQHQHHHHLHQHQNQHHLQQQPSQQHHQHLNSNANSNKHYQSQYGRGANMIMSRHQSKHQPQDEDYYHDNDGDDDGGDNDDTNDTFSNEPRSRSPSRPRRISIAGGTVANKEFDIHFIPPTTMPTAFTTQQHNDIIVDFIGSAWEEVANSKVTKVYDGQ